MKIILVIIVLCIITSFYNINKNKTDSIFNEKKKTVRNNLLVTSFIFMVCVYLYFKLMWVQILDVGPEDNRVNYTKKMLWINMDKMDVTNRVHKRWSYDVLVNHAPNILGCYVDVDVLPKKVTKQDMLKHIETFNMMFKHPVKYMYVNGKVSEDVVEFLKEKDVKVVKNTFRRTIK